MHSSGAAVGERPFRHEALLYASDDEFLRRTTDFLREGLARGEAILTVVDAQKIARIRAALGNDADGVQFADMQQVGRNPALIIQAWHDFVTTHGSGRRARRGIGEPISTARNDAALTECQIHEALLNIAFRDVPDFWLLCPYDTTALGGPVVEHALANHPFVCDAAGRRPSATHAVDHAAGLDRSLPAPRGAVDSIEFDASSLAAVRQFVTRHADEFGIDRDRVGELAVAVSEITTNTVIHGRGRGVVRIWVEGDQLLCEVHGPGGYITDPLVGRLRPAPGALGGRGVWLANHFCDLVQIRSSDHGTTVRLHIRRA